MADSSENQTQLDRIQEAAEALARRVAWEQGNRIGLLGVHAVSALLAGAQQLLYGSAPTVEHVTGLWIRPVLGLLALLGGLTLLSGLRASPRSILREFYGLVLIGTWDFTMTAGLVFARISGGKFSPLPFDQPIPNGYASPYAVTVYGGLFALIVVHLLTLRTFRKRGAPPAGRSLI